jgi:hypothetical protein
MFTLNQIKDELVKRYKEDIALEKLEEYLHIWKIEPLSSEDSNIQFFDENSVYKILRGIKLTKDGYNESIIPEILHPFNKNRKARTMDQVISEKVERTINEMREEGQFENINTPDKLAAQGQKGLKIKVKADQPAVTNPAKPLRKIKKNDNVIKITSAKANTKEISEEILEEKQPEKSKPPAKETKGNNTLALVSKLSEKVSEKVSLSLIDYLKTEDFINNLINYSSLKRDNEILARQVQELLRVNSELEEKMFAQELEKQTFKKIWKNFYIKLG